MSKIFGFLENKLNLQYTMTNGGSLKKVSSGLMNQR